MNIHQMTIKEIKVYLDSQKALAAEEAAVLAADSRAGVLNAYRQWLRRKEKEERLAKQWDEMSTMERALWKEGHVYIAGIDEVGRGPLAGPVLAAAVILPQDFYLPGLNDSKKVPAGDREKMYETIMEEAVSVSIGMCDAPLIDEINIYQATLRAMLAAVQSLHVKATATLNDAVTIPGLHMKQHPIIGGDGKSVSIAAASIVAKVRRDRMMAQYDEQYPGYNFASNMGYGTAEHLAALKSLGPTPIHRKTFAGVLV
ncbi:ribonuclease HII [Aneurinibacillus tyrosinisolvens]|uniref:ribonuclease HII n=1 Tax=Aneurinibacillus tyrosinisolvens TaxID=1443435 RepID=UPI00063ED555|nr:ribonuclease HII [Aneurinibacillus tyrosinisolvens]